MYSGRGKSKNVWILLLVMLAGIVAGGFIGELLNNLAESVTQLSFLKYLSYGISFGIPEPFSLDLGVLSLTFGFMIKFTVLGIAGMFVSGLIYRKL